MRRLVLLPLLLLSAPSAAADRRVGLSSFDRLRVTGPIEVRVMPGSPSATVSGDPQAAERVEVRVDGTVLTLRLGGGGWNLRGGDDRRSQTVGPVTVTLSTPRLQSVSVFGGARVAAARLAGERVDVAVSGAGSVSAEQVTASEQFSAALVGAGEVKVGGTARRARLVANGPARIDASGLRADELHVRLDGPGEVRAAARYRAEVDNSGLGSVDVAGTPECRVRAPAGGPVRCGGKAPG